MVQSKDELARMRRLDAIIIEYDRKSDGGRLRMVEPIRDLSDAEDLSETEMDTDHGTTEDGANKNDHLALAATNAEAPTGTELEAGDVAELLQATTLDEHEHATTGQEADKDDNRPAFLRLCDATELLEMILCYLSAPELCAAVSATGAEHPFYRCISGSNKLKQIMLLRPSGRPQQIWRWVQPCTRDHELISHFKHDSEEPEPRPSGGEYWIGHARPVRLCPLLWVTQKNESSTITRARLMAYDVVGYEVVGILSLPEISIDGSHMLLTDPPIYLAYVDFYYTDKNGDIMLRIKRDVKSRSPLTLSRLLEKAYREDCPISLYKDRVYFVANHWDSPHGLITQFKVWFGIHIELDLEKSYILLYNVVVPSEEEWEGMREDGVWEENIKKGDRVLSARRP